MSCKTDWRFQGKCSSPGCCKGGRRKSRRKRGRGKKKKKKKAHGAKKADRSVNASSVATLFDADREERDTLFDADREERGTLRRAPKKKKKKKILGGAAGSCGRCGGCLHNKKLAHAAQLVGEDAIREMRLKLCMTPPGRPRGGFPQPATKYKTRAAVEASKRNLLEGMGVLPPDSRAARVDAVRKQYPGATEAQVRRIIELEDELFGSAPDVVAAMGDFRQGAAAWRRAGAASAAAAAALAAAEGAEEPDDESVEAARGALEAAEEVAPTAASEMSAARRVRDRWEAEQQRARWRKEYEAELEQFEAELEQQRARDPFSPPPDDAQERFLRPMPRPALVRSNSARFGGRKRRKTRRKTRRKGGKKRRTRRRKRRRSRRGGLNDGNVEAAENAARGLRPHRDAKRKKKERRRKAYEEAAEAAAGAAAATPSNSAGNHARAAQEDKSRRIATLVEMGISKHDADAAVKRTSTIEGAVKWLAERD